MELYNKISINYHKIVSLILYLYTILLGVVFTKDSRISLYLFPIILLVLFCTFLDLDNKSWADSVVDTINVGVGPFGVAYNSNNNDVYVANTGSNTVSVINRSNSVVDTINVGSLPVGVTYNSN